MRRRRSTPYYNPFEAYGSWMRLSMQASEMLMSSAQVIAHRTQMMQDACNGKIAWTDPELMRMWMEKIQAGMEAGHALSKGRSWNALDVDMLTSLMRPYHSKVTANAKRLRRKRKP